MNPSVLSAIADTVSRCIVHTLPSVESVYHLGSSLGTTYVVGHSDLDLIACTNTTLAVDALRQVRILIGRFERAIPACPRLDVAVYCFDQAATADGQLYAHQLQGARLAAGRPVVPEVALSHDALLGAMLERAAATFAAAESQWATGDTPRRHRLARSMAKAVVRALYVHSCRDTCIGRSATEMLALLAVHPAVGVRDDAAALGRQFADPTASATMVVLGRRILRNIDATTGASAQRGAA